jgi:hypothetical protein
VSTSRVPEVAAGRTEQAVPRGVPDLRFIEAVPVIRASAVAVTPLALAAFAVAVALAPDWTEPVVGGLLTTAVWSAMFTLVFPRVKSVPPPRWLAPGELLPRAAAWKPVARDVAIAAGVYAAADYYSVSTDASVLLGMGLALPVVLWCSLVKARRTERKAHGTLWMPAGVAWRANNLRYLSPR